MVISWDSTSATFRDSVVSAIVNMLGSMVHTEVSLEVIRDDYLLLVSVDPASHHNVPAGSYVTFSITVRGTSFALQSNETLPLVFQLVTDQGVLLNHITLHIVVH